jgi:hypothetical protein
MANVWIMNKGSKPGDTPALGTNVYDDTPTNPLIVCTDTISGSNHIACYEIRKDNSLPIYGDVVDSTVDSNGSFATSVDTVNVDGADPRIKFEVGQNVYNSTGTLFGTIASITCTGANAGTITFTSDLLATMGNNVSLYTTQGVSNSIRYQILNRLFPNSSPADTDLYLTNLENTPGYRITCAKYSNDGSTVLHGQTLSGVSVDITTDDYFVVINNLDPLKHHVAKITAITSNDVTGDSFEFSPKYGSEIAKDTKFTIYRGPLVSDTNVVAVGYGLYGNAVNYESDSDDSDGAGGAADARHAGMTYVSKPFFYFYNDRLNKKNELDHNTKYMLHYSRDNGSSATHYKRCFLTCQDYGLKVVDYSPYTMNATLVDVAREKDKITSGGLISYSLNDATGSYGQNEYVPDVSDWDKCFINNKRNSTDLNYYTTVEYSNPTPEGAFTGPTTYLHYDTSPDLNNIIPEVIELNVFDSVNESGSYTDLRIVDTKRIYGKKIKEYDKIKIKKLIDEGSLSNNYEGQLPGTWTGESSGSIFTVTLDNENQDLRVLLKSGSNYEEIKVGNYIHKLDVISDVDTTTSIQLVTIADSRLTTTAVFTGSGANIPVTITAQNAYRKPWSKLCENLIVNFTIDTTVTYTNIGLSTQTETIVYNNNTSTTGSASGSRLYNSELVLNGGTSKGLIFKIDYGDSNHNIIKLQTPRLQLYRLESNNNANFLDYYTGGYSLFKIIFVGEVETFENYVEDGMMKYHIAGRNKINKLFGPIINKNYKHCDDIIYSTYGPFMKTVDASDVKINNSNGYYVNTSPITVDGTTAGNTSAYDTIFKDDGSVIGFMTSPVPSSTSLAIRNDTKVSLDNNDNIWALDLDTNMLSFSKALESNPTLITTPSSLKGTSNKGLIFTSGRKLLRDTNGELSTRSILLAGTSSNSDSNALGYNINSPLGISTVVDVPFMGHLHDEINSSKKEIHTVNSLTEYEIVDIDTGDGKSIIELAPNCPIVMGRIDGNPEDVRFETLTKTTIQPSDSTVPAGRLYSFLVKCSTTSSDAAVYTEVNNAINDEYVYTSSGTLLGKVLGVRANTSSAAYIILDRPLPESIANTDYFYTATKKTQGLYLLNTQGLRNGGVLQLVNSELDAEYKPVAFQIKQTPDGTQTDDSSNKHYCAVNRYGSYSWRYLDLQKGTKGAISYIKKNKDGNINRVYSMKKGQFNAYAPAYRFSPGFLTAPLIADFETDNDFSNSYQKAGSHETRGIYPAMGSNFADYDKYPSGAINTDYTLLPKKAHNFNGGPWNIINRGWGSGGSSEFVWASSGSVELNGLKANGVKNAREHLEIIDPKTIRTFLFSTADLYPDSMIRKNHIANHSERDFADYSIMLKSKPAQIKSNVKHDKYEGGLNQLELSDDSYESININSASINPNELKRFGLMRLTEMTLDWHFNEIDPENPPPRKSNNVPYFKYIRYQKLIDGSETISSISGADIVCENTVDTAKFVDDTYVFDANGNFLGEIDSVSSATITCKAAVIEVTGAAATGDLYYLNKGISTNTAFAGYTLGGKDGDDTFVNFSEESADSGQDLYDLNDWQHTPRPLNMLQGAVFNGYGALTDGGSYGSLTASDTSTPNTNNEGYGYTGNTAIKKAFIRKLDMAVNGNHGAGYLNHLVLPPIFEGFTLTKLTASTVGTPDKRLWVYHASTATVSSGTAILTNAITVDTDADSTYETNYLSNGLQLQRGDRLYTDNGIFVGTVDNITQSDTTINGRVTINIYENLNTTIGTLTYDDSLTTHELGTLLCKGGTTVGGIEIASAALTGDSWLRNGGDALSTKNLIGHHAIASTASSIATNEFIHSSRVLGSFADFINETSTWASKSLPNIYRDMRAVTLSRHNIENSGNDDNERPTLGIGTSFKLTHDTVTPRFPLIKKVGSDSAETKKDYAPMILGARIEDGYTFYDNNATTQDWRGEFAKWKITRDSEGQVEKNRGNDNGKNSISDGGEFVFKPIFDMTSATITYTDSFGGRSSSLARVRINTATDVHNSWIRHAPDLTGCYLVSTAAKHIEYADLNSTDNHFTQSINNQIPKSISYIVSHEIIRTGATLYHNFLIDNMTSGTIQVHYRVMRPNQVCFYPKSPTEIDLYKMSSSYTKRPDSPEMYNEIPLFRYYEDGHKFFEKSESDNEEAIQSMYVVVNPDHTSTESFLIPRGTNYDHYSKLFGINKTFEKQAYDFLLNDGSSKERKQVNITIPSNDAANLSYTRLNFNEDFSNTFSGVTSLGEVFTIQTATSISLRNPRTASIGTGITIGMEAEDIINDILEENNIIYENSTITYPYFTAPNIQGADIYNTSKFLAELKNKEILIDKETIKIIANNVATKYTNIEINENDANLKIIEISQNKSGFDTYNEVIVYGNGVKSVKRNISDIKKNGKQTIEEFDNNLTTPIEVERKARNLLKFYNTNKKQVTVKLANTNVEWIKSGDIITIDYPSEHIPRGSYIILEVNHDTLGSIKIQAGAYSKALDSRLAEIIIQQKKMASFLRSDRFKASTVDSSFFEKIKLKPIQLTIRKSTVSGGTTIGLSTTLGFATTLGAGTITLTELLKEDLT